MLMPSVVWWVSATSRSSTPIRAANPERSRAMSAISTGKLLKVPRPRLVLEASARLERLLRDPGEWTRGSGVEIRLAAGDRHLGTREAHLVVVCHVGVSVSKLVTLEGRPAEPGIQAESPTLRPPALRARGDGSGAPRAPKCRARRERT